MSDDIRVRFQTRNLPFNNVVSALARQLALAIEQTVPEGRERNLAWTKLEEVVFWSMAAKQKSENPHPGETVWGDSNL